MGVMRDVLARFSVLVDDAPLTKLDKRINKLKDKIKTFGQYAGAGLLLAAGAAYKLIDSASAASETMNVLTNTFGANSDAVVQWSKDMGKQLGRSEFTLQEYASKFGSFLEPQFRDTGMDIAEMSKQLSALAVDLASFYNTSDDEANLRLFSGLSGETEAVRRLGIDISDTSLTDFNRQLGDPRGVAQLNLQEKTLLRYRKILRDTEKKQGDAARTAKGWANSLRRLQDQVKSFMVRMGQFLEGPGTKFLWWAEQLVKQIETLTLHTSTLHAVLVSAMGYGIYAAGRFYMQLAGVVKMADLMSAKFWMFNLRVLGVVAAFVLLEDIITLIRGGDSVVGRFITDMTGIQRPLDLVNASLERMSMYWDNIANFTGNVLSNVGGVLKMLVAFAQFDPEGMAEGAGMLGWDTSSMTLETDSEQAGKNRGILSQRAAAAGDKKAYMAAMTGSGLSDAQLQPMWLNARGAALASGAAPNDYDVGSGLVQAPEWATMSNAERAKLGSGGKTDNSKRVTVNVNGGDPTAVKQAVKEALAEDDRAWAAEVAELAPQEAGGI